MAVIDSRPEPAPPHQPVAGADPGPAAPPPEDAQDRVRSLFRLVGSVVAPATLLTALLLYFGWAYTASFFKFFGLDVSLMGLTTQDYLINSVQVLFVPLAVALGAGLLIAWLHTRVKARLGSGPETERRVRWAAKAAGGVGLVLFGIGMVGVFLGNGGFSLWYPLSLGTGAVLVAYASRLRGPGERSTGSPAGARSTALLEVTAAFFIVALSLFWAATNYAFDVGKVKAAEFERTFVPDRPEAILYSKEPLFLQARDVHETSCAAPAGGYRFRYNGLRLMLRSAGKYFLLPATWSRVPVAIVVPESDAVRLQFEFAPDKPEEAPPDAIVCPAPPPTP